MSQRARITINQQQRLSLNPALSTAIRVLGAGAAGIAALIEEQAAGNPALVVGPAPRAGWLPRWRDAFARHGGAAAADSLAAPAPGLAAHVAAGIAGLGLDAAGQRLAAVLADALEPSGWLGHPLAALARDAQAPEEALSAVLVRLHELEPAGLFARDLAECLSLQAREAGELDPPMRAVLARLPLVAAGNVERIAREAGLPVEVVAERIARLRRYDPKPGAAFAPGAAPLREPDLVATRGAAGWEVALNRSALPTLSLAAGRQPGRAAARALIGMVERRNATLLAVAAEIMRRQEAALEHGLGALMPMRMEEVAGTLGLHRTTVGRLVAATAIDTPRGTWWLRALFSAAPEGMGTAAAALRARLARLIAEEDPARPLSDDDLAGALAEAAGGRLARRTVAKYRAMLGLAPAHGRRRRGSVVSRHDSAPGGR